MATVTIEVAQERLPELINGLVPGQELAITRDARTVAILVGQPPEKPRPLLGRGKGKVVIVSEDEDHLNDFEDYMP